MARTPTGNPPGRRKGCVKTGGRRRGSLDLQKRKLIGDKLAADLVWVYEQGLGGRDWLLSYARENPGEFLRLGLSRLFPAPLKDDPDVQINQQVNVSNMSDIEIASRIAFALSKGVSMQEQQEEPVEAERVEPEQQQPTEPEPPRPDLPVTEKEKQEQAALEPYRTPDCWPPEPEKPEEESLATYRGTREEQRGYPKEDVQRPRLPRRR